MEAKEESKKEKSESWLVDGKFNKQRRLHTTFVLGNHQMSRSLHPPSES